MTTIQRTLNAALLGIMIGSTIFVMTILLGISTSLPTPLGALGLVIISAFIGGLSEIVNRSWLPVPVLLGLHFVGSLTVTLLVNFLINWAWVNPASLPAFILNFIIFYIIAWVSVYAHARATAHEMNQRLRERNRS